MRQTVPPARWIIVDDGSTDETLEILKEYARRYDCIRIIRRADRGRRSVGPGVVDAFYVGLEHVDLGRFDYLCKLDLDLELPSRYFEVLMGRMNDSPRLGTCSGKPYYPGPSNSDGSFESELISEGCGDEMSVGMTKLYRIACFQQVGGFVREVMWDGIDCHRCRMHGWIARSWDEPALRFIHLRPMGASDRGILTGRLRHGRGQYYMGTDPLYMLASAVYRMTHRPWVIGGLAMGLGYLEAWLKGRPRHDDPPFRRFLRRYQRACLLRGKRAATRRLHEHHARAITPPVTDEPE